MVTEKKFTELKHLLGSKTLSQTLDINVSSVFSPVMSKSLVYTIFEGATFIIGINWQKTSQTGQPPHLFLVQAFPMALKNMRNNLSHQSRQQHVFQRKRTLRSVHMQHLYHWQVNHIYCVRMGGDCAYNCFRKVY